MHQTEELSEKNLIYKKNIPYTSTELCTKKHPVSNSCSLFLSRYLFRSGNTEHPSDRFYNTTVEILPASLPENSYIWSAYNSTTDGFLIIGSFNEFGIAEGTIEAKIGKIKEIRLHVHTDSENWAILSEVSNFRNIFIDFIRKTIICLGTFRVRGPGYYYYLYTCYSVHFEGWHSDK